jgi:hypothetical protein
LNDSVWFSKILTDHSATKDKLMLGVESAILEDERDVVHAIFRWKAERSALLVVNQEQTGESP